VKGANNVRTVQNFFLFLKNGKFSSALPLCNVGRLGRTPMFAIPPVEVQRRSGIPGPLADAGKTAKLL
jgi:hypothetical protein